MHINLPYGNEQIPVDVPDNWINGRCYRPHPMKSCADVRAELMICLGSLNLDAICKEKKSCVIAVETSDEALFRELLPALIEEIEDASDLAAKDITILLTNRAWLPYDSSVISKLFDEETRSRYKIVLHDPLDKDLIVDLGTSSGGYPLTINKLYVEAELKIVLGGVQPDLLLGFTGGRSVIMPGLAGKRTLRSIYNYEVIENRHSRFANYRDNIFHTTGIESISNVGCHLAVSALLDPMGDICEIFTGHFGTTHMEAMNLLREKMYTKVKEPMDIVVTSCAGHPYDRGLSQLIEALCAVKSVLKPGGTIIIAADLPDGVDIPVINELCSAGLNVKDNLEFLRQSSRFRPGQWFAQRFYSVLKSHEVILFNKSMDENVLWSLGVTPARDMNEAIFSAMEGHGQKCKIVALPDGPRGIAELTSES
jgi:lactate racemase